VLTIIDAGWLLKLSTLGIYLHATFLSITLGSPLVIIALLLKFSRSGEEIYFKAARTMTAVLAINFALGAVTGTLVEFGLVQAWPGTILAIASFAFIPLALELIAFANEIATLVLFIVTLGKVKTKYSVAILSVYWLFAVLSGILIMSVNSWLVAPWGTGIVAKSIYPFMPEFGSGVVDAQKLLAVKILALASNLPVQAIIQNADVSEKVGIILSDPFVALESPFAAISALHAIFAALLVGTSISLLSYALKYWKTRSEEYLKILKVNTMIVFLLFLVQPTIFGHFMGVAVAENNPTKFAMMENAEISITNPLVSLLAYGDMSRKIAGFEEFEKQCESLGSIKLGELAGLDIASLKSTAKSVGLSVDEKALRSTLNIEVRQICLADLGKAKERIALIHTTYYTKITFGVIGFLSAIALFAYVNRFPAIYSLVSRIFGSRAVLILSIMVFLGSAIPSVLGWYVREVGRKPWTVYGLLYPEELITVVEFSRSPEFAIAFGIVIASIAVFGILAMYTVATRWWK